MTPNEFTETVRQLQDKGFLVKGFGWKTELAFRLGVTRTTIDNYVLRGTTQRQTDFALAAILAGVNAIGKSPRDTGDDVVEEDIDNG